MLHRAPTPSAGLRITHHAPPSPRVQVNVFHCMTSATCACGVEVQAGADGLHAGVNTTWPWWSETDHELVHCLSPTDAVVVGGVRGVHVSFRQREALGMMGMAARTAGVTVSGEFFSRLSSTSVSGRQYTVADFGPLELRANESINLTHFLPLNALYGDSQWTFTLHTDLFNTSNSLRGAPQPSHTTVRACWPGDLTAEPGLVVVDANGVDAEPMVWVEPACLYPAAMHSAHNASNVLYRFKYFEKNIGASSLRTIHLIRPPLRC